MKPQQPWSPEFPLHFQEEVAAFGQDILPIVRELEADLARKHGTELDLTGTPAANAEVAA